MIAIDTNILVYAEITTSLHHKVAKQILIDLAQGDRPWALPWPCVYEFLRVVTNPRVCHPPMPLEIAQADLQNLFASPTIVLLSETERHIKIMHKLIKQSKAKGNLVHDAHIATLCIEHGVTELFTADRDFLRFKDLQIRDPFNV
ncbi:MAG: PIN domain-containing protein [Deltaproteobacteria bacterium]|nr:PIN domain-containing protein [Deltaproteobacteria bacterium]